MAGERRRQTERPGPPPGVCDQAWFSRAERSDMAGRAGAMARYFAAAPGTALAPSPAAPSPAAWVRSLMIAGRLP
jgi:hypothetical protein